MITRQLFRCERCAVTVTLDAERGRVRFDPACPTCDGPMVRQAAGRVPSCRNGGGAFDVCTDPDERRGVDKVEEVIGAGRAVVGAARVIGSLLRRGRGRQ